MSRSCSSSARGPARSWASTSCRRAAACAARCSTASTRATATGSREFVTDFAPTVVAHFGVYEPASRMSPASAIERTELCTIATMSAAARAGKLDYVVVRSGLEVYGPVNLGASGAGRRR